jgi:hypothetical protein
MTGFTFPASIISFSVSRSSLLRDERREPLTHKARQHVRFEHRPQWADPSALRRADKNERSSGTQDAPETAQRPVAHGVEDQVVPPPSAGEVLLSVVDDMIHAKRLDQLHVARAADHVTSAPSAFAICTANVPTPPTRH